MFLIFSADIGN